MSGRACLEVLPANLLDHRAVKAWRRAARDCSEPQSVEVLKLKWKTAVYRLTGTGPDGLGLIAKRCLKRTATVERMIYEDFLGQLRMPALRYYGSIEEPDGDYCWQFLEDAGGGEYRADIPNHRVLAGRWLGTIHSLAMQPGLEGRLPGPQPVHYLNLLQSSRESIRNLAGNPLLPDDDVRTLRALLIDCDVLESRWGQVEGICQDAPRTIVHGDLVRKNLRVRSTAEGPVLLVFDWENAGWGVPGTDLAQFAGRSVSPDLAAYRAAMKKGGTRLDARLVRRRVECATIFRLLDVISWACSYVATDSYLNLIKPIACLR